MLPWVREVIGDFTPGAAGIWTLVVMILGMFAKWHLDNRKLDSDDREARRSGYASEVAALRAENRELAADMRRLREEYDKYRDDCHKENNELRDQVNALRIEIARLRAVMVSPPPGITLEQADTLRALDEGEGE